METETPLIADTIALAEKKVAMALDDIIKLSKRNTRVNKGKRSRRAKNKNQNFKGSARNNISNVQGYVNSLSSVRQGAVVKRRSNFKRKQFPVTTSIARKATTAPPLSVPSRAVNAGRMTSANQSRLITPPGQNRFVHARFIAKVDQKVEKRGGKWKTLDSRFAIMKEQRMSNNNNNKNNNNHNNGVEMHVPRLPPWARARRFTF